MVMYDSILNFSLLALASGRVGYSLVHDDIFRPARELVWRRSAPEQASMRVDGELVPARMVHPYLTNERELAQGAGKWELEFDPHETPRDAGFFGKLVECHYCMTFWTSVVATAGYMVAPNLSVAIAAMISLWAAANTYAEKGL